MTIGKIGRACFIASSVFALAGVFSVAAAASDRESTQVYFENSCKTEVQADFSHAVTLLHSFEYPESPRIFRKIMARDPDCAMARWGVAMNLWHPLWAPPSKADLEQGARVLSATDKLSKTPREAAYIDALKAFYSSTDRTTHNARAMVSGHSFWCVKVKTGCLRLLSLPRPGKPGSSPVFAEPGKRISTAFCAVADGLCQGRNDGGRGVSHLPTSAPGRTPCYGREIHRVIPPPKPDIRLFEGRLKCFHRRLESVTRRLSLRRHTYPETRRIPRLPYESVTCSAPVVR